MENPNGTILSVNDLKTYFQTRDGVVKAVDGVSFDLKKGETLGIVGESGSGKTVASLSLMRLVPPAGRITEGSIDFNGNDIRALSDQDMASDLSRSSDEPFWIRQSTVGPRKKLSRESGARSNRANSSRTF